MWCSIQKMNDQCFCPVLYIHLIDKQSRGNTGRIQLKSRENVPDLGETKMFNSFPTDSVLMQPKTKKGQDIRLSICSYVARLIVAPLVAICISAID